MGWTRIGEVIRYRIHLVYQYALEVLTVSDNEKVRSFLWNIFLEVVTMVMYSIGFAIIIKSEPNDWFDWSILTITIMHMIARSVKISGIFERHKL